MDRRKFFGLSVAAGGLLAAREARAQATGPAYNGAPRMEVQPKLRQQQQFRIGYTTNTRGGWEGDPFVGISEGRDVGFRYFEIFGSSFCAPESWGADDWACAADRVTPQANRGSIIRQVRRFIAFSPRRADSTWPCGLDRTLSIPVTFGMPKRRIKGAGG
ncbi:MAG: hypothetical protein V4601_04500 [Pseudomonadota bacterium]